MNALSPSHIKDLLGGKPFSEEFWNVFWIPQRHCGPLAGVMGETEAHHYTSREDAEQGAIDHHDFPRCQYQHTIRTYRHRQGDPLLSEILDFDPGSEQDRRAREEARDNTLLAQGIMPAPWN